MSQDSPTPLHIQLLGDFALTLDNAPIRSLEKPRQQSLLAYLAFHQGKPQTRTHLAFTFWPDSEEKQALTNLRNLLFGLRQSLPSIDSFIDIDKQSIGLREDPSCLVDIVQLKSVLARKNNATAVELYTGKLLPKFHDEWLERERDSLHLEIGRTLSELINHSQATGDYEKALHYSKIRIHQEPLSETSQYKHIELLARQGDKASALLAFQTYEKQLEAELEIAPGDEIQKLRDRITQSAPPQKGSSQTPTPQPATSAPQPKTALKKAPRKNKLLFLGAAALIALALLIFTRQAPKKHTVSEKSLAVLPFDTRSQREEDRFFADGFHDDLITSISRIQDFDIISRTSTIGYRDTEKDLKQIGKELGVATIIEGGVQRHENQIRINIQLIDASTGFHIWAENYTRETTAENIFDLQTEITEAISKELQGVLLPQPSETANKIPTQNLAALEAYFFGQAENIHSTSGGYAKAIEHYKRAIALDPDFSKAHAAIALAYLGQIHFSGKPVEGQVAIAQSHIAKALELDNSLSDAYVSLGHMKYHQADFNAAERAYEKAIELDPNKAPAYHLYSISRHYKSGDLKTALKLSQKATELDPRNSPILIEHASILMSLNRVNEAKEQLHTLIKQDPKNSLAIGRLGGLYDWSLNRYDEAIRLYREAYSLDPTNQELSSSIAWAYLKLGDEKEFISWSERDIAIAPGSHKVTFLKGFIHEFRGQDEESIASFAALKRTDIFYDWAVYKVTAKTLDAGKAKEALEWFTTAYPWITNPDVAINHKNVVQIIDYVYLLQLNGRQEPADELGHRILKFLPGTTRLSLIGHQYFDSHLYIALGDKKGAYDAIQDYLDVGGCSSYFETEVYTKSLREEPEFKRFLAINNSRLTEQRQNLANWETTGELAPIPDLEVSLGR